MVDNSDGVMCGENSDLPRDGGYHGQPCDIVSAEGWISHWLRQHIWTWIRRRPCRSVELCQIMFGGTGVLELMPKKTPWPLTRQ